MDSKTTFKRPAVCCSCNQPGHVAVYCKNVSDRKQKKTKSSFPKDGLEKHESTNWPIVNAVIHDEDIEDKVVDEGYDGLVEFKLANFNNCFKALFDTGSPISLIRRGLVEKSNITKNNKCKRYQGIYRWKKA